jgi:hypothetical protein
MEIGGAWLTCWAAAGETPWAIRPERARDGPGDEEPGRHRQHVDAGPERCPLEAVAVQRKPYSLQPDDQHEHQAAAAQGGQERGDGAEREGLDAEQGGAIGSPVAVINAVADALAPLGARITGTPLGSAQVLAAVAAARG